MRYFRYRSESLINLNIDQNNSGSLATNLRFQGFGLGGQIGYLKVWRNGFTVDYHIGLGYALSGLRLKGEYSNIVQAELQQAIDRVNEFLDQIPLLNVEIPNDENFNINTPVATGPWPIIRTSLSIGYAF